jgi:zinc D-Ala-D-Ala dipeptidase
MWKIKLFVTIIILSSCNHKSEEEIMATTSFQRNSLQFQILSERPSMNTSQLELQIINKGLIDINTIDTNIIIDLKYATDDNFLGFNFYGSLQKCYLEKNTAEKLHQAQIFLEEIQPDYNIIVFDCVSPLSAQQLMWDSIDCNPYEKSRYVSNPLYGSNHNFGCAVDVSIVDSNGLILDMGCDFDVFDSIAYPIMESYYLSIEKLNTDQIENRQLLRYIMYKAGFFNIQTEWWHFNSFTRDYARKNFPIVE